MEKKEVHLHFHLGGDNDVDCSLNHVLTVVNQIKEKVNNLMATTEELAVVLGQVNEATNKMAASIETITPVITEIGSDVDALIAASQQAGVPQEIMDLANAIKSKAETASGVLDPLVVKLQETAAKYPVVPPVA